MAGDREDAIDRHTKRQSLLRLSNAVRLLRCLLELTLEATRDDELAPEAEDADAALRPKTLAEFVGQQAAKENLRVFIESAKSRRENPSPRRGAASIR